jgi:predicted MFS family arabinose efflux permease
MIPAGFLCDKFHIVRMTPLALLLAAICHFGMYFFIHDKFSLYIGGISIVMPSALVGLCSSTIGIMLLPKEKYGQFMSALGIVFSFGVIFGNWLSGLFFDFFPNYQLIMVWNGGFELLACIFGLLIVREWRRLGGIKGYVPPLSSKSSESAPAA